MKAFLAAKTNLFLSNLVKVWIFFQLVLGGLIHLIHI